MEMARVRLRIIRAVQRSFLSRLRLGGLTVSKNSREAFRNCTSLTSITILKSVLSIEYGAFYGCSSITSVNTSSGVYHSQRIFQQRWQRKGNDLLLNELKAFAIFLIRAFSCFQIHEVRFFKVD